MSSKYCATAIQTLCNCHLNIVQLSSKYYAIFVKICNHPLNIVQHSPVQGGRIRELPWEADHRHALHSVQHSLQEDPCHLDILCIHGPHWNTLQVNWSSQRMNEVFLPDLLLIEPPPNDISYGLSITTFKKQFQPTILPYHTLSTPLNSKWRLKSSTLRQVSNIFIVTQLKMDNHKKNREIAENGIPLTTEVWISVS